MSLLLQSRNIYWTVAACVGVVVFVQLPTSAMYEIRGMNTQAYADFPVASLGPLLFSGVVVAGILPKMPAAEAYAARRIWIYRAAVLGGVTVLFTSCAFAGLQLSSSGGSLLVSQSALFFLGLALIGATTGRTGVCLLIPYAYLAAMSMLGAKNSGEAHWWVVLLDSTPWGTQLAFSVAVYLAGATLFLIRPPKSDPSTEVSA